MVNDMDLLKKEIVSEFSNSPYWKEKSVLNRTRTSGYYQIKFGSIILNILINISGDGIEFDILKENNFPIKRSTLKNILKHIKIEREFKQWEKPPKRNYDSLRSEYFANLLK